MAPDARKQMEIMFALSRIVAKEIACPPVLQIVLWIVDGEVGRASIRFPRI